MVPPPTLVGIQGPQREATRLEFLHDDSWLDNSGKRQVEQTIFDTLFAAIDGAKDFIYLDLFLFNDWQGPVPELTRGLSVELTDRLLRARQRVPAPQILVVTDPINTVYGGAASSHLDALRNAGVVVVVTDLWPLQDSNMLWSSLWRWLVRPFGNTSGAATLPNPLTEGRVSLRSWLALLNFKANHRKVAVIDDPTSASTMALVMSANPHDGSSAHRNVALKAYGPVVRDLLEAERQVPGLDQNPEALGIINAMIDATEPVVQQTLRVAGARSVGVINESAILRTAVDAVSALESGDAVNLEMFYLSERRIVKALGAAARRGVTVRVLLDVNSDAFGRAKNGVPNRPVAAELTAQGVAIRWCATAGEQCHAKWLHTRRGDDHTVVSGSGNFTRRNLRDFNLESDLVYRAQTGDTVLESMLSRFERQWRNEPQRTYSLPYEEHADDSLWLKLQYRVMEGTGLGTF